MVFRDKFIEACKQGDTNKVKDILYYVLEKSNDTQSIQFVSNQLNKFTDNFNLSNVKVAVLSSFTIEPVLPHLMVRFFLQNIRLQFTAISYQQWYLALNSSGVLDKLEPNIIFILLHLEDVLPLLSKQHLAVEKEIILKEQEQFLGALSNSISNFRNRSQIPIILSTFVSANRGIERNFDRRIEVSKQCIIDELNSNISMLSRQENNIYIFDYAQMVTDVGRNNWYDLVKSHHIKMPLKIKALSTLAGEMVQFYKDFTQPRQKVLVVDLDNTLWGGIIGEDGIDGISIGGDYPGNAFYDFQSYLLNLKASGIALAIASKNNEEDVKEVFSLYPEMPLMWSDFSSHKVNWNNKVDNLKLIAKELNVGLDTIVFADDNPMECDLVSLFEPQITVINLKGSPSHFPELIRTQSHFSSVSLTNEDRDRTNMFNEEKQRKEKKNKAADYDSYLKSLDLQLKFTNACDKQVERIVQLFNKTNQFNLTTKRYDVSDVIQLLGEQTINVKVAQAKDCYGNYGIIGIAVIKYYGNNLCEIDSFLLSCRILGRNIEQAMLAIIDNEARKNSCEILIGSFFKTKKNDLTSNFYLNNGFVVDSQNNENTFVRNLYQTGKLIIPNHIRVIEE